METTKEHHLGVSGQDYIVDLLPNDDDDRSSPPSSWRLSLDTFRLPSSSPPVLLSPYSLVPLSPDSNIIFCGEKERKVSEYYKKQEKLLEGFNEMETINETGFVSGAPSEEELKKLAKSERLAVNISNAANLVLFVAKVYASVESRSMAVIASTLDSLLDLLSGFILCTEEKWMIGIMASATVIKFLLMLYCRSFQNEIVRAYAQDHLFDVVTNSVEDMRLHEAHNIGETLQEKLEQLSEVERAFVHIDFEFTHRPEHKYKV
ncbi:hypothetical protein HID58_073722 [Brassica napus]|uniref:Cation efflux protein cytoplasmic domain-containing protein n=1 Tax=Brassica napus TaxID=3708 RepID=A0ABQ7XEK8_BRANA|nr:hypothetical protein HID58_073722 [Brassica napus]